MSFIYGIHFYYFHGGYFGFDDIEYCRLADSLLKGNFTHDSLYAHRYAGFALLAFNYSVFGVTDFANFLTGFLQLCIIVSLYLWAVKDLPINSCLIGALFLIFAPMHLMYVEKPMPDITIELGFFICFLSYYSEKFNLNLVSKSFTWFAIGVILIFFSKETFLIFYPFFLILMLSDIFNKRHQYFWKKVLIILSVFGLIYLLYSYIILGDFFARVHHIFAGQYISACSYDSLPFSATLERIGFQLWNELIRNLFLIPLCFLPMIWASKNSKFRFIAVSFISLLLLSNFMSISYTSYAPLCPDPRHVMYVLPIGALLIAFGITNLSVSSNKLVVISLVSVILLLSLSVFKQYENTWLFYLPLMGSILLGFKAQIRWAFVLMFIAWISVFVQNSLYNKKVNYKEQKQLNISVIDKIGGFKYIITDRVNHDYGLLHSRFDTTKVRFLDYKALDTLTLKPDAPQYLIINGMTSYFSNTSWESLPEFARTAHEKLPKIYENKSGTVYKVK